MKRRPLILSGAAGFALAHSPCGAQESYPSRPVRVLVAFPAGGVIDVLTRAVTQSMDLGQPIVVENRPGASGNIATEAAARSAADGYTILVSAPFLLNNPMLGTNLRWAPKDLVPVARLARSPSYFCVPMSLPARTLREFAEVARKAHPPMQYVDGGSGTPQAMSIELLMHAAGIKLEPIAYKGAPPAMVDLISGAVSLAVIPSSVAVPLIKANKLRVLANTNSSRSAQLPDVPTVAEAGFPEATVLSWIGLHAPAGTPAAVVRKLDSAVHAATERADVRERLASAGGEAAYQGTQEFTEFLRADTQMWDRINRTLKK